MQVMVDKHLQEPNHQGGERLGLTGSRSKGGPAVTDTPYGCEMDATWVRYGTATSAVTHPPTLPPPGLTCPLVSGPAPMPMVGMPSSLVTAAATTEGTHSSTTAKQPAASSACPARHSVRTFMRQVVVVVCVVGAGRGGSGGGRGGSCQWQHRFRAPPTRPPTLASFTQRPQPTLLPALNPAQTTHPKHPPTFASFTQRPLPTLLPTLFWP